MSLSLRTRCIKCNTIYNAQTVHTTTPACPAWEPCVVESAPVGIDVTYVHSSGVAFFAYDEAAKTGAVPPAWAAATIPANSDQVRRDQLEARIVAGIATNTTYIALAAPSTAQNTAQLKALTRQVQALLRLRQGQLNALD